MTGTRGLNVVPLLRNGMVGRRERRTKQYTRLLPAVANSSIRLSLNGLLLYQGLLPVARSGQKPVMRGVETVEKVQILEI
jgi:hypothetical protein